MMLESGAVLIVCDIDHTLKLRNAPWMTPAVPGMVGLLHALLSTPPTTMAATATATSSSSSSSSPPAQSPQPGTRLPNHHVIYLTNRYGPTATCTFGKWSPHAFLAEHGFPEGPVYQRSWTNVLGFVTRAPDHKQATLDACMANRGMWSVPSSSSDAVNNSNSSSSNTSGGFFSFLSSSSSSGEKEAPPVVRRVVLIGDSVEKDAWIYAMFAKRFPTVQRVDVCVRMVNRAADAALVEKLLAQQSADEQPSMMMIPATGEVDKQQQEQQQQQKKAATTEPAAAADPNVIELKDEKQKDGAVDDKSKTTCCGSAEEGDDISEHVEMARRIVCGGEEEQAPALSNARWVPFRDVAELQTALFTM